MKKLISLLFILLLSVMVVACGTTEQGEKEETPDKNQTVDETNGAGNKNEEAVELTEEDQKFTKLLVEKDYDALTKETVSLATASQKNFYYLVTAFKKQQEIDAKSYVDPTTNETNYNDIVTDNKVILNYFNRASYIPDEVKDQVNEMKKAAEENIAKYEKELE